MAPGLNCGAGGTARRTRARLFAACPACLPRLAAFLPPPVHLPADEPEDVVLGHAARDAGAANLRDVDVVLLRDLPHERRRPLADRVLGASMAAPSAGRLMLVVAARRPDERGAARLGRRTADPRARDSRAGRLRGAPAGAGGRRGRAIGLRRGLAAAVSLPTASSAPLPPSRGCVAADGGADHRDDAVDRDRLAFLDADLRDDAGRRRRNLRVDLVGRDLEQRLVAIDRVADFFIQRTIVPSAIDSPICGMTTSVAIVMNVSLRRAWHVPLRRSPRRRSGAREWCESALRP